MEYRIEADGELFPDPHNDAREGDRSVIEFPGYAPPRWLTAPDPGPSQPLHDGARLWSPPGADPRRPLPLLVAHDGSAYEREAQLPRLIAAAIARDAIPPCRDRAARLAPARGGLLRVGALRPRPRRLPPPPRAQPRRPRGSARASARSPCSTPAGSTPARSAPCCCSRARSSASAGTARSRASPASAASAASSAASCTPARPPTPIPITLTCGAPEENLANNRAVATALRRQGHPAALHVTRDAHNFVAWRDALDPLSRRLARAGLGVTAPPWRART